MKHSRILVSLLPLAACTHENKEQVAKIEGLYAGQYAIEYSAGRDTIEIRKINTEKGTFRYTRRTAYRRLLNTAPGVIEHKFETSTAVFNERTAQLMEEGNGRIYSFSPGGKELVCGSSVYRRIEKQ